MLLEVYVIMNLTTVNRDAFLTLAMMRIVVFWDAA
jgi:hypothetical protein